jgi:hypothetical protein
MKTMDKTELLQAMKKILKEYKKLTHSTTLSECSLCQLYYVRLSSNGCASCPMNVFFVDQHSLSCLNRRCAPINCDYSTSINDIKIKAVIEFYVKAIAKVAFMKNKELNEKDAFKFLINIDNKAADKYELKSE